MSKIEWTNITWNPIIGCTKVSAGCKNCYAEKMAFRLANMQTTKYYKNVLKQKGIRQGILPSSIPEWNGKTYLVEHQLNKKFPGKGKKIFVCSMGDLFHEKVEFDWIDVVMGVIYDNPQHTFQILTKRPERAKEYIEHKKNICGHFYQLPKNIWLGVTVEDQQQADIRIPILLDICDITIKFVSVEPMLEKINLTDVSYSMGGVLNSLSGEIYFKKFDETMNHPNGKIDWVICGGETGPAARDMKFVWVYNLLEDCEKHKIPFFFKQWGGKYKDNQIACRTYNQFPNI